MGVLFISGCSINNNDKEETPEINDVLVVGGGKGEYSIILPFSTSPLRQAYANYYRDIEMMEIGRELQERSKSVFDPKNYFLAEGTLITEDRYYELIRRESDENLYGLNLNEPFDIGGGVVIPKPTFVSDIIEVNFHKNKDKGSLDGVSLALVMKRIQTINPDTGEVVRVSDDILYEIGVTLGQKLHSYIRTLEGASGIPIMIGLYVQESDEDRLPGNYLPGHYIGFASFESARNGTFAKTDEYWTLLSSKQALEVIPEAFASFSEFKRKIFRFTGDEHVGVIGKVFIEKNAPKQIQFDFATGAKTYLELYGMAEAIKADLSLFDAYNIPIKVNIKVFETSRIIINKEVGKDPVITVLN